MVSSETVLTRVMNSLAQIPTFDEVVIAITKLFLWIFVSITVVGAIILLAKFVKHIIIPALMSI